MKFPRIRFSTAAALLLWSGVIVLGAWLAAYHQRRDFADFTPAEQIDSFTPTRVIGETLLDGGTRIFEATARDGSYVVTLPHDATVPLLVELCTVHVRTVLVSQAPETAALRRSLQRALASGRLGPDSESAARALGALLSPGVAVR